MPLYAHNEIPYTALLNFRLLREKLEIYPDVRRATHNRVFIQKNGRYVVRGRRGTIHLFDTEGNSSLVHIASYRKPVNKTRVDIMESWFMSAVTEKQFQTFTNLLQRVRQVRCYPREEAVHSLRLSESELQIYDGCIKYVIENCPDKMLYKITGAKTKEELESFRRVHNIKTRGVIAFLRTLPEGWLEDKML